MHGRKNSLVLCECCSFSELMDVALVCSCIVLGAAAADREVRTVESLADGDRLHPVQRAFVDMGAVQCGFCTPGLIVSTYALLKENPEPSDQEVREALSGTSAVAPATERSLRRCSGPLPECTGDDS